MPEYVELTEIIKRLKKCFEMSDLSYVELERKTGIAKSSLQRYINGTTKKIPIDAIQSISIALGISPAYIMGWDNEYSLSMPDITTETVTYPVIGDIAAGYDHMAIEDWRGETVEIPVSYLKGRKRDEFFVLQVIGDSMYPLYQEGDKVLILKQSTLNFSGQIGAILYDDCATLKKVEYVNGENWLKMIPINPMYPPKVIEGIDLEQCRVLGIPKLLIREI